MVKEPVCGIRDVTPINLRQGQEGADRPLQGGREGGRNDREVGSDCLLWDL